MDRLATDRCLLNPLGDEDRADVARLYADQEVRRFLGGFISPEQCKQRFEQMIGDPAVRAWTLRVKATSSFLGLISVAQHHDGQDEEISYQLLPEFWGQGYACEALVAVIEYAASVMKLPSLIAETQCGNHASRRLLERVGMEPVRTLTRFGEDQVIYRRTLSR